MWIMFGLLAIILVACLNMAYAIALIALVILLNALIVVLTHRHEVHTHERN
jgi:hypothetical protein